MRRTDRYGSLVVQTLTALATLVILVGASAEVFDVAWGPGDWLGKMSLKWALAFFAFVLVCLLILAVLVAWFRRPEDTMRLFGMLARWRDRLGWGRWLLAAAITVSATWFFLYSSFGVLFTGFYLRLFVFLISVAVVAALLTKVEGVLVSWSSILVAGLIIGSAFTIGKLLTQVTDYPFALYWSEGNRFWDYSVLYGRRLYTYPSDQPLNAFIDRGRQSLWGLPFLFFDVPIWGMRLWDVVLSTIPYALLGWTAVKFPQRDKGIWFLFGLWVLLFLNQGPVYSPLVLAAILVAGAYRRSLWLAIPIIALAGYYTNLSRSTWMFAPAIWAGMLALVHPATQQRSLSGKDWARGISLVFAGFVGGFGIPRVWPRLVALFQLQPTQSPPPQGSVVSEITSAAGDVIRLGEKMVTQQALLWSRLLPNATYSLGILLGLLLATLPLILLLIYLVRTSEWKLNVWQVLALVGPLTAFLAVGLVASVKIGGGSNLHNLDMFLIGLVFTAALVWDSGLYRRVPDLLDKSIWARLLLLVLIFVPAFTPWVGAKPLELPPTEYVDSAVARIDGYVTCAEAYGEVLFMDSRQLLTFGDVRNVPLVPEYEKKLVMDMALAGDEAYFQAFYADLEEDRFSLIVSDLFRISYKNEQDDFAEENNAWMDWVAIPLFEHQEVVEDFRLVGVQLFMPRERDFACP